MVQKRLLCGASKKTNRTLMHELEGSHFDLLTGRDKFSCRGPGTSTNREKRVTMEHEIPFGNSNRENGPTFLDFPLFLGIFQWDEPTKRVPFTAGPKIPKILTKWKAPRISAVVSGIFQWDEPKNRLPFASNRNFREFVVNGKQPRKGNLCQGMLLT